METIKCNACGSNKVVLQGGYYVCQYCGTKSLLDTPGTRQKPFPVIPKNYLCPEGAIDGPFSVGPNEWILFSKGNLQNQTSTGRWRFAEHQYDFAGETAEGWNDLFDWEIGTSQGKMNGSWFVLSKDQWEFLLKKRRVESDIRFVKAQVAGVNGLVLLPDNWDTSRNSLMNANRGEAAYSGNLMDAAEWETSFQSHGAVFLPAAGCREGANIAKRGSSGFYWSSTGGGLFGRSADCMLFDSVNLDPCDGKGRSNGFSVRLVCPVKR